MNIVTEPVQQQQQQHDDDYNKEILMKRLANASQYKIYPSVIPRNELPLRKILLTTRLWNHVRRQQALLTTIQSDDWMFDIPTNTNTTEEKKRSRSSNEQCNNNSNKKPKSTIDYPATPAGPANNNNPSTTTNNNAAVVLLSA